MKIKEIFKKIAYGKRYSSETYINYLRKIGVQIGEDCTIYVPTKTIIDEQYPWMIKIGSHVRITEGVKLLTHDFSWSVMKLADSEYKGSVLGASGKIDIGNNVFIGMNAIITRNVCIGDNVIIGAGSIVTKDCASNGVYAGNPAKFIMSLDEYTNKRAKLQVKEAKELVLMYYKRYGKKPEMKDLHEYFMLFSDPNNLNPVYAKKIEICGNQDESISYMKRHTREYDKFDEFIEDCLKGENKS